MAKRTVGFSLESWIHPVLRLDRALRLVWLSGPRWALASFALLLVQAAIPLLSLYLLKLLVDSVSAGISAADRTAALDRVVLLVALAAGVAIVGAACRSAAALLTEAQGIVVTDRMLDMLHAKSIAVDYGYYEDSRYFDTLHQAQREAPFRPMRILTGLIRVGQGGLSLLAIGGLLFSFHWSIGLALFVVVIPGTLARVKYASRFFHWYRSRTELERMANYLSGLLVEPAPAKEIRLFSLGPRFMSRFRDIRQRLRRVRLEIATRRSLAELATEVGATIAVFGAYAFIAVQTLVGLASVGTLVMYIEAFRRAQGFLQELHSGFAMLYEDNLFLSSFDAFLGIENTVTQPARPEAVPQPLRQGVVFEQVEFAHPGSGRRTLNGINLRVHPGETVALVGANGSGKTTLVKLLCRLYGPTGGSVTLDGIDLRRLDITELRKAIAVLFQDFARYNLSVRENIALGDAAASPAAVGSAATRASVHDVIEGLSSGYDTLLGKRFGEGEELSIGEWQKLALARAFVRDAPIIVLDEPTSAIDPEAERDVMEGFRALVRERTGIVISHRLSTVTWVDRIYVLEGGRVVESGPHAELLRRGGVYARLFEAQAQFYR